MMMYTLRLEVDTRTLPATVFRFFHIVAEGKVPGPLSRKFTKRNPEPHPSDLTPWDQSQRRSFPLYRRAHVAARKIPNICTFL